MVDEAVGYDGGKKIKGCKRFTLVDTLGLLIVVQSLLPILPNAKALSNCSISFIRNGIGPATHPHLGRCWFFR
jgi:hypothetical protein